MTPLTVPHKPYTPNDTPESAQPPACTNVPCSTPSIPAAPHLTTPTHAQHTHLRERHDQHLADVPRYAPSFRVSHGTCPPNHTRFHPHLRERRHQHLADAGQHAALDERRRVRPPQRPQRHRQHAHALQRLGARGGAWAGGGARGGRHRQRLADRNVDGLQAALEACSRRPCP